MATGSRIELDVDGTTVGVSNPDKVFFPAHGYTKSDLIEHYRLVGPGASARGVRSRPTVLEALPERRRRGLFFFQKRIPAKRPDWLRTVRVRVPSGRTADELCPTDLAHIVWMVNLGCVDLNPWAVRRFDLEHPDELRVDLDPMPGVYYDAVRCVAMVTHEVLHEHGLVSWPKTSGLLCIHIVVRLLARWDFTEVRRVVVASARERSNRRAPTSPRPSGGRRSAASACRLQPERPGPHLSRRPTRSDPRRTRPCRRRCAGTRSPTPSWATSRSRTMPTRWREVGDLEAGDPDAGRPGLDESPGLLESLLELAARDERGNGLGDAPWPPNFPKAPGEARRVAPSRRAD